MIEIKVAEPSFLHDIWTSSMFESTNPWWRQKKNKKQKTSKQKKNMATDVWMFVNVDVATEVDYK